MANALQIASENGFINEAEARGVEATGWSWSGKFGDLDNDRVPRPLRGQRYGRRQRSSVTCPTTS